MPRTNSFVEFGGLLLASTTPPGRPDGRVQGGYIGAAAAHVYTCVRSLPPKPSVESGNFAGVVVGWLCDRPLTRKGRAV